MKLGLNNIYDKNKIFQIKNFLILRQHWTYTFGFEVTQER